jgi:pyruvate decarboxylase
LHSIDSATDAPYQIDHAIRNALREKKPAYIEIACNVASALCAAPGPVSAILGEEPSDPETLRAAIAGSCGISAGQGETNPAHRQQAAGGGRGKAVQRLADC